MKKRLLDLLLMIVMIVGGLMLFIGMLQFNEGFKNEITGRRFFFIFNLLCGLVLMIGSYLVERRIGRKSAKDAKK